MVNKFFPFIVDPFSEGDKHFWQSFLPEMDTFLFRTSEICRKSVLLHKHLGTH